MNFQFHSYKMHPLPLGTSSEMCCWLWGTDHSIRRTSELWWHQLCVLLWNGHVNWAWHVAYMCASQKRYVCKQNVQNLSYMRPFSYLKHAQLRCKCVSSLSGAESTKHTTKRVLTCEGGTSAKSLPTCIVFINGHDPVKGRTLCTVTSKFLFCFVFLYTETGLFSV